VRCADETASCRDDHLLVQPFIAKVGQHHIVPYTLGLPTPTGTLLVSTLRIVGRRPTG
jgi:hypothetical protein